MSGTILENLSNRKLFVVLAVILTIQIASFLIGAFVAPAPASTEQVLATRCRPQNLSQLSIPRFQFKPRIISKNCDPAPKNSPGPVVFSFQLPLPREGIELDYSRWMSNLLTLIVPDLTYRDMEGGKYRDDDDDYVNGTLLMRVRLAVRNQGSKDWIEYGVKESLKRSISCHIASHNRRDGYRYDCEPIPLFELQSLFHDFYLINLEFMGGGEGVEPRHGDLEDVTLVAIHANGGFTKVWICLKSIFLVLTLSTLVWFLNRMRNQPMNLLEKTLTLLGVALSQLNLPLEALSLLTFDLPFFNCFLSDLRQGFFYVVLFCFWLIFTGEHLLVGGTATSASMKRNQLSRYYRQLSIVMVASIALLAFDSVERGIQGFDPFFNIWDVEPHLATLFLATGILAAITYFSFLAFNVVQVLRSISSKQSSLPSMSLTRRLIYQGIIYRFKFLLFSTLLCAALTLAAILVGQWANVHDQDLLFFSSSNSEEWVHIEWTSAMYTSIYAAWNCYVMILLILYAPSHKFSSSSSFEVDSLSEETVEFNRLTTNGTSGGHHDHRMISSTSFSVDQRDKKKSLLQEMTSKQAFE